MGLNATFGELSIQVIRSSRGLLSNVFIRLIMILNCQLFKLVFLLLKIT